MQFTDLSIEQPPPQPPQSPQSPQPLAAARYMVRTGRPRRPLLGVKVPCP